MAKSVKEIKAKIAARKAERTTEKKQKYAKMRSVATKAPEKLEKCLASVAAKHAALSEGIENLRENLGLIRAAKNAPLKVRVAAAREYGKQFKLIASESPDKLAEALVEAYHGLNDIAADLEMAADQMGVDLNGPMEFPDKMGDDTLEDGGIVEESVEEGESPESELPADEELPVEEGEKEASGSDAWVTDRDDSSQPKTPKDASTKTAMSRKDYIIIADALRSFRMPNQEREELAKHMAKYLRSDNFRFSEGVFVNYVLGRGGSRGGGKFKGEPPNAPDTLFIT